jgi:hypothetical protein
MLNPILFHGNTIHGSPRTTVGSTYATLRGPNVIMGRRSTRRSSAPTLSVPNALYRGFVGVWFGRSGLTVSVRASGIDAKCRGDQWQSRGFWSASWPRLP